MTATLLTVLVPVFFVLGVGVFAGATGRVDRARVGELNALVMEFLVPAALFVATATTPRHVLASHLPYVLAILVALAATYAIVLGLARLAGAGRAEASVIALVVAFPNLSAVGLPLTRALFGVPDLVLDAIPIALGTILLTPITLLELERHAGGGRFAASLRRALTRPLVTAPILGLGYALGGLALPGPLRGALTLLGEGAGGVGLFVTGIIVSAQRPVLAPGVLGLAACKNLLQPAVAFAAAAALGVRAADARVDTVLAAVPCGFFGILFGLRYGVRSPTANAALLASTLGSVATLPLAILFAGR